MERREKAVSLKEGFNCCQSVLSAFAADFGLDRQIALKIGAAFGGGLGGMGEVCGAVSGGLMVIGLKYGLTDGKDRAAKTLTTEKAQRLIGEFSRVCGSVKCRELLGCDVSTPEGREHAQATGLFATLCPRFVDESLRIVETLL